MLQTVPDQANIHQNKAPRAHPAVPKLRGYQAEAAQSAAECFRQHSRVLLILPTASGKSIINAEVVRRCLVRRLRVLCLTAQAEILEQNERAIKAIAPDAETGIYCAGLARKELDRQVVLASRDSLARITEDLPVFDVVIVDEAHMIDERPTSQYQKIFASLEPRYVLGLTGTPWRLGNGRIWGDSGYFEKVAYNVSLDYLTEEGYLCPHTFPKVEEIIDASQARKTKNDYIIKDLEAISSSQDVVARCIDRWQDLAGDRRCTIFFCCSRAHAEVVVSQLNQVIGRDQVGYIDGTFAKCNREAFFERARAGGYKALVNIGVLTTGVDIPIIDCVTLLRPTLSAALFVQMCGRGLRNAPGKTDCLMLDLAGNFARFESLSTPLQNLDKDKKKKTKRAPPDMPLIKKCSSCEAEINARAVSCDYCGEIFIKHTDKPFTGLEKKRHQVVWQKHYKSETSKGEQCWILDLKLDDGKRKRQWLLTSRSSWPGPPHRSMLYRLQQGYQVQWVKIDHATKYKNIIDIGWSDLPRSVN